MQYIEYLGIIAITIFIFIYYLLCRNDCIILILKEMLTFNINNSTLNDTNFTSMKECILSKYKTLPFYVRAIISLDYFTGLIYMVYYELPSKIDPPKSPED